MKIGEAVALLRADISDLKKSTEGVKTEISGMTQKTKTSMKDFSKAFISAQLVLEGMKVVVGAVKQAVDFAVTSFIELGLQGDKVGDVAGRFQNNFKKSTKVLEDLRKSVGGTVSDFDLMKSASQVASFGITKDSTKIGEIWRFARAKGEELEMSATDVFDQITKAVGKGRDAQLKELGLTTDGYDKYIKKLGDSADALTDRQKAQLLLNDVLKQSRDVQSAEVDSYDVLQTKLTNMRDELAQKVAPAFEIVNKFLLKFVDGIVFFAQTGDFANDFLGELASDLGMSDEQFRALAKTMEEWRTKAIEIFQQVGQFISGNWKPLLVGALTVVAGTLVGLIALAWTFISPVLAFMAVITAVGVIVVATVKAWQDNFMGVQDRVFALRDAFFEFLGKVQAGFNAFMSNPAVQWFINTLKDMFIVIIANLVSAWETLRPPIEDFIKKLGELWVKIQPVIQVLLVVAGIIAGTVILVIVRLVQILSSVLAPALNVIIWIFGKLIDWINSALDGFKMLKDGIVKIWNSITNFFQNSKLGQAIIKPFQDAWNFISEIAEKIRVAVDKISPFHHESPSLVDKVKSGIGIIKDNYKDLGNISFNPVSHSLAPALATSGGSLAGGTAINIDMAGANISSPQVAEEYAEMIGDKIMDKLLKSRRAYG